MKGSIASIETLTSVDGPGIRTIVFMSGCKKRCLYCHNPEMLNMSKANTKSFDLVNKLLRYKNYFKRGGGVTFSGGEPLLQTDFLIDVCIAIDTAGDFVENVEQLLKLVDLVILDIKHIKKKEYEFLTSSKINNVEKFINILNKSGVEVQLRQVIIPNFNDNLKYIKGLKKYIRKIKNVSNITFIPYHKLGQEKYLELGISYKMEKIPEMDKKLCDELYQEFLNL